MPVLKAKYNGEWINVSGGGSGGGSSVQSDWNQHDSTQLDYIKNRTHYDEGQPYEISIFNQENMNFVEEPNMDGTGTMNIYIPESYEEEIALENLQFTVENTYTIIIDGTSYSAQAKSLGGPNFAYIGNLSLAISVYPNTNENFLIIPSEGMFIINDSNSSHNITITETRLVVEKEIVSQSTYSFSLNSDIMYLNITDFDFSSLCDGDLLIVNYNGQEYSCNVTAIDGLGLIFGNGSMFGFDTEWHNEPFTGMYMEGMSGMYAYPTAIPFRIEKIISDTETEIIISEDTPYSASIGDGIYYDFSDPSSFVIEPETSYKIFWNNIEYIGTSSTASDYGNITLEPDSEGDIPFVFEYCNNENEPYAYFEVYSGGPEVLNEQIQIDGLLSGVKKLDKKYIPNDIDLPIASYNKVGVVKVRDTQSGLAGNSNYTPIYLDTNDNQIYAKARSSMSTLTFTGATSGSYNGSSPVTINIPTGVPTVSTSDNGKVLGVVNGAWAKYDLPIQEMNPLTFTGLVEGTYDGSQALTINIPIVRNSVVFLDQTTGEDYSVYVDNGQIVCKAVSEVLMDFDYTRNDDGTYTINSWKGTLNGETSTECIVPSTIVTIVE